MAMQIAKLGLPLNEFVVSKNKFVANHIFPIAIKSTAKNDMFLLLFYTYQDFDDSVAFFQLMVHVDNPFDQEYLFNHHMHIKNTSMSPEREKMYTEYISKLNTENIYASDFDFVEDKEHKNYYHSVGIRGIDNSHAAWLDIYLPRNVYIKIRLYLDKFINTKGAHEFIFLSPKYNNLKFESIEQIKYDATSTFELHDKLVNISHYTMHCGPTKFVMNLVTPIDDNHINSALRNPLDINLYMSFYKDHTYITDIIVDKEYVYLLYEELYDVDNKTFKAVYALKIPTDLINTTNFVDCNKNIYIE